MNADRSIALILITLAVVIAIPGVLYLRTPLPAELSPTEKQLAVFTNQPVAMASPPQPVTFSGRTCPVPTPLKPAVSLPKLPLLSGFVDKLQQKLAPRTLSSNPVVSMIYYAGYTRMAIVDNHVVNEGSDLDGGVIVKIEKTRVLMRKAGKDIWLTTE